ncbi:histidine kinase [uncultured Winogradskyella sp.]|uniref:sensor histidine kinase n=1 Tax=uncultured Winogradskyella sp. TaxID=395353 RepID=UPI0030DCC9A4
MNFKITNRKKKIIKRFYKIVLVLIGIVLVIFNDTFGKLEGFVEFIALYFIIIFITISHWLFKQIKSIIKLKNEKAKTELLHLKSQVNPHFFFNTLNNLYGLVGSDTKKAQELILKLSDMMRYSIYEGEKEVVTLKAEVDYLNNYIGLHKMRYHKQIDVKFEAEIEDDYKVMPLLFIILLENAFKHGIENLSKDAYVYITIKAKDNKVFFEIENNFDQTLPKEDKGIGLKNLKRRLELVYPKKHTLSFSATENVYKAKLTLQL